MTSEDQRSWGRRLRARLLEVAPEVFSTLAALAQPLLFSARGVILFANDAAAHLLGAPHGEALTGVSFGEIVTGDTLRQVEDRIEVARTEASLARQTYRFTALDGREVAFESIAFRFPREIDGEVVVVAVLNSLEGLLTSSQAQRQLVELFEQSSDGVLLLDEQRRVLSANGTCVRLLGASAAALEGQPFEALLVDPPAAAPIWAALDTPRLPGLAAPSAALEARHASGRPVPVELALARLHVDRQRLFAATLRDRSASVASERALRESEGRYRALFDSAIDGIFVADAGGQYVDVNPAGCAMLGYTRDELLGLRLQDLTSDGEGHGPPVDLAAVAPGRRRVVQRMLRRKDGALVPVEISGSRLPGGQLEGVVRDLSERHHQEEALRQASKLDAVGRLAGGVAHDFNNILTVILSLASALSSHVDADGEVLVTELEQTGTRAAELTKQLLAFARRQPANPKVIELNEQIRSFSRFLTRTLGEDVRLELSLASAPLHARLDPVHLEQILLNLAVNAREAMPSGGTLTIASHASETQVFVVVTDTGTGMTEHTMTHLFEPFFTTKERGRGTGLGLATVYGIVKQANGELSVSSGVGQGSRFLLAFPLIDPALEAPAERRPTPVPARAGLALLVVEDDLSVRRTLQRSLEADGHSVHAVGTLEAALERARSGAPIELLITDVVMPDAGGKQVADAVRALRPGLPVLFVSGYAPDTVELEALGELLPKPFTQQSLRRALASALQRRR